MVSCHGRPLLIEYTNVVYRVTSRGNHRQCRQDVPCTEQGLTLKLALALRSLAQQGEQGPRVRLLVAHFFLLERCSIR